MNKSYVRLLMIVLAAGMTLTACAPQAPEVITQQVTVPVAQTVIVTQLVEVVVTATPEPATAVPSEVAAATPMAVNPSLPAAGTFNAWCIPNSFYDPQDKRAETGIMPTGAVPMQPAEDRVELISQMAECDFVYQFQQPVQPGTKISIFYNTELGGKLMDLDLKPLAADQTKAFASSTTLYIIDPPFWFIDYVFKVIAPDGKELRSDNVRIKRSWDPGRCYGGVMPDPVTLKCPPLEEAHPWDPYYGWDNPRTATPPSGE